MLSDWNGGCDFKLMQASGVRPKLRLQLPGRLMVKWSFRFFLCVQSEWPTYKSNLIGAAIFDGRIGVVKGILKR